MRPEQRAARRRGGASLVAAVAVVALLTAAMLWRLNGLGRALTEPIGGPFTLVDTAGHTVTDRDFRGRTLLIYFGYTSCPDICPTTLHTMGVALGQLGPKRGLVQAVFITLDPARDTPDVLRAYVAAIDPRLVALTGSDAAVAAVLRAYRVRRVFRRTTGAEGPYRVDHSAVLYLIGPDGRFVAPVRADEPADRMAADIARHVS